MMLCTTINLPPQILYSLLKNSPTFQQIGNFCCEAGATLKRAAKYIRQWPWRENIYMAIFGINLAMDWIIEIGIYYIYFAASKEMDSCNKQMQI